MLLDSDFIFDRFMTALKTISSGHFEEGVKAIEDLVQEADTANDSFSYSFMAIPMATVYAHLGDFRRALTIYENILERRPDHPPAIFGLALVCAQSGDRERAAGLLSKCRTICTESRDYEMLETIAELEDRLTAQGAEEE